ncbi:hypothetical protein B0H19DRAFT_1062966 [Mycena capillaripes]|nr:hypothetical protein B0H19DRAFT_1062966 [Mycena capillaripes]
MHTTAICLILAWLQATSGVVAAPFQSTDRSVISPTSVSRGALPVLSIGSEPIAVRSFPRSLKLTTEQVSIHCPLAPARDHQRELSVVSRAADSPEQARTRGLANLAKVAAATSDVDKAQTTDKFQALYASLFKKETITNKAVESDTALGDGNGKQIFDLLTKLTEDASSPDLQQPLLPNVPTSFQQVTSHEPGQADVLDNNPAYQLVFSPGLIVVAAAFREFDPVEANKRLNLNIIAMELYKAFKGEAPPTDLRFILQINVANPATQASLESVYTAHGVAADIAQDDTEWVRWDATTYGDDVAMLLGTDNGLVSTFLLADYKTTVGGKTVAAVQTRRQAGQWAMATEYS